MPTLKLGSTTALTESSGALTINVANPTVTLGSNTTFGGDVSLSNATFPTGHVRQVKVHSFANIAATNTDFNIPDTTGVGFDSAMSNSSNDVVLFFSVNSESYDTSTTTHWYGYWNGGSFPSLATSSSNRFADAVHYGHDGSSIRCQIGATEIDTNPGSTTPLYSIHVNLSMTAAFVQPRLVLMEICP